MAESPTKRSDAQSTSSSSSKTDTNTATAPSSATSKPTRHYPPNYQPDFLDYVLDYGPTVFRLSIISIIAPIVLFTVLVVFPLTRPAVLRRLGSAEDAFLFKFEHMPEGFEKGTQGCKVDPRVSGCEDMAIHHSSGTVFMACGDPTNRLKWFPPILPMCTDKNAAGNRDTPYKYDPETATLTPLKLKHYDGDLRLHGLSLYQEDEEPGKVWLHFVNHRGSGSCVTMFKHFLGTDELDHVGTVCNDLIVSPNDVAATSRNSFYVTNDHRYSVHTFLSTLDWPWYANWVYRPIRPWWPTFLRIFEDMFGPFRWTNVIHCQEAQCRVVADGLVGANGILISGDRKSVLVNNFGTGTISIFDRDVKTNDLTKRADLVINAGVDNLSYDPNTDEYLVGVFPNLHTSAAHFFNPNDPSKNSPSAVVKFKYNANSTGEIIWDMVYYDPGKLAGDTTIAVSDGKRSRSFVGNVMSRGIVVCDHAL
ncbi:hypothetical protein HDU93_000941 [Gonapodya sp. JEL0774]|nr:hypothetical protein HDU93_000941 [Gonapodya sp. JEL0774]